MWFRVMLFVWEFLLDLAAASRLTDSEKDLKILLLRQQLRIVERKQERGPQIPRWQKVPLAALAFRVKRTAQQARTALENSVRLFQPATLIGWHQAIVRRKWTVERFAQPDRPPIDADLEDWIVPIARENPRLGYDKLVGELRGEPAIRYLIHDHDTKFTERFDEVFESTGAEIVPIPFAVPNANAFAERWVRSVRKECWTASSSWASAIFGLS